VTPWADAALAAELLAVDPRLGGACLRARRGPAPAAWLDLFARLAPDRPALRLPPSVSDERLLGGLDLAATLAAGLPVAAAGLLTEAAGRTLVLPLAERTGAGLAARIGAAMDAGAGFVLVALDEGAEPEERAPEALVDRLAFRLALDGLRVAELTDPATDAGAVAAARARLLLVRTPRELAPALAGVAAALGIGSARATLLALAAARAAAALTGRRTVDQGAAEIAARLVLAPRARALPAPAESADPPAPPDAPAEGEAPEREPGDGRIPEDVLLEAARAAIPPDLVARLMAASAFRGPAARTAGAGADRKGRGRGRPAGARRGHPRDGGRLDVIETLRAAAPWQTLRRPPGAATERVLFRADDFRVKRAKLRAEKALILAVDASGSTALARLGEAKGAVELMLAQTYVARQQVALIAFRGQGAELLLPPTRSLVLAKRRLAALPGGGGTPLAAGLAEALALVRLCRDRGVAPCLALLTDGRANVALDGAPGRERAEADALRLAGLVRAEATPATVVDTSPRPGPAARRLAEAMGATYLALPHADARALSGALGAALAGAA
jgi:magnesium chelatase subunit D